MGCEECDRNEDTEQRLQKVQGMTKTAAVFVRCDIFYFPIHVATSQPGSHQRLASLSDMYISHPVCPRYSVILMMGDMQPVTVLERRRGAVHVVTLYISFDRIWYFVTRNSL